MWAVVEESMKDDEFVAMATRLFGSREFSVKELVQAAYGRKPRSETAEYRELTGKLRVLEKRKLIYSRKKGNLKWYRTCERLEGDGREVEVITDDADLLPADYLLLREMVVEGLRTGRIPLSGLGETQRRLVPYLSHHIERIIDNVKAPYEKVAVRATPLYIEIVPLA